MKSRFCLLFFGLSLLGLSSAISAPSLVDRSFDPGLGVQGGAVEFMTLQPDGKVLICGNFTSFDDFPQGYIARVNSDGKRDTDFRAYVTYWTRAMAVQPDGKIVIGGFFTDVQGERRNCVARLNYDGSLDMTFNPGSGCQGRVVPSDPTDPFVYAVAVQKDGKIIIAGNFTNYNGMPRNSIVRVNEDGSVDSSFDVGAGANSWLRSLLVQENGQILVSGWLTSYRSESFNRMVRVNPDGSPDLTLNPYFGDRTAIYSMVPQPDGKIVVSGHSVNTNAPFLQEIVRLNPDGTFDRTFNPGGSGANDKVESVAQTADGKFVIGGYFSSYNGFPTHNLARLKQNGTLDESYLPLVDNWIYTVAIQPDGRVLLSGGFTSVDGIPRSGVARLHANLPPPGAKPVVTITTGPAENSRLTNGVVTLSGTGAGDVAEVYVGIGDHFTRISGTTNWTTSLELVPGANVISVKAIDIWGNESIPVTRDVFYVVRSPITLLTNGPGRIVANFGRTNLTVGDHYTLKAIPASGFLFSNWTGSIESDQATLTFEMQQDMTLQANFVPDRFRQAQGVFNGLFQQTDATATASSGILRLTLTTNRTYSGRVQLAGSTNAVTGKFDSAGESQFRIVRPKKPALTGSLQMDFDAQQIRGTISDGNWDAPVVADRAAFSARIPATSYMGRYTISIPGSSDPVVAPTGNGFAVVNVSSNGTATAAGTLADGTPFTQSARISKDGTWPLFVSLYSGRGLLLSTATLNEGEAGLIGADATWIRPSLLAKFYPQGFTNQVQLEGSRYRAPKRGAQVMSLSDGMLSLEGGNLAQPLVFDAGVGANNRVTLTPATNRVNVLLVSSNGLVQGSFVHPVTRSVTPIRGVVLQQANRAAGFFRGQNQSGAMVLRTKE